MTFPMSNLVRCKCERCGFDGHHVADIPHVCLRMVNLDAYERDRRDAARYRFIRAPENARGHGEGSPICEMWEVIQSINSTPEDMDAAIDKAMGDTPNATPRLQGGNHGA